MINRKSSPSKTSRITFEFIAARGYHALPSVVVALLAIVTIAIGGASWTADAAVVSCGSTISTCGCTITKPGFYQMDGNLDFSQGLTAQNGCIDIKASNAVLNTAQPDGGCCQNITGPGGGTPTGIGIHILKGANNNFVELPSSVNGWDVGILIEGSNNVVEDFGARFNNIGFEINGGKNNNVNDFSSISNLNYGAWLRAASNNQVNCSNTNNNGNVGVYVGCSAAGPISAPCSPKVKASKGNKIYDHSARTNAHYGIAIDLGNTDTVITDIGATSNATFDLFDANPNCDNNLWFFASFGTASQNCIHH